MQYIYNHPDWPEFTYDRVVVDRYYLHFSVEMRARTIVNSLMGTDQQKHLNARCLTEEIVSSLAIEGERTARASLYSSICERLEVPGETYTGAHDHHNENLATLYLDAVTNMEGLTTERLQRWHSLLFSAQGGLRPRRIGVFRSAPVYINKRGRETIYEGIGASMIDYEMNRLITFINEDDAHNSVAKAAIASLWLLAIHPFEDGNGRISRAMSEYILTKEGQTTTSSYSISATILKNRDHYYRLLEEITSQAASLDVTSYLVWHTEMAIEAIRSSLSELERRMRVVNLMKSLDSSQYNSRQLSMLYKLADGTFVGKLTTAKWAKMNKCSSAAAARDLQQLVNEGLLYPSGDRGPQAGYLFDEGIIDRLET